jgi:homopolymeric O-antigen transport system ATP-binding protein
MRFLRDFKKRGTMLFVSHDGGAVTSLCDRAVWLEHGRVQCIGEARVVMDAYLEASLIERQGGVGARNGAKARWQPRNVERRVNPRQELLDRSILRNDILLFPFRPDVESFGEYKARVTHVAFCDEAGQQVAMVLAGEQVTLEIELQAEHDMDNVIVGFYIKDRLGQLLFGDNTVMSHTSDFEVSAGETFQARFRFEMPRLGAADYFVTIGVAEGTQEQHVIQHWLHEALRITASGGGYATGLVGVPMHEITLERIADVS